MPRRSVAAEPACRGVIERLGGPIGRRGLVGTQPWWTPLRVLIAVALTFLSLGYTSKANCLRGATGPDGTAHLDWSGNRAFMSACYNDILPLYSGRGLDTLSLDAYAYSWLEDGQERFMEYPVLAGYFQGLMGTIAHATYPLVRALSPGQVPEASWYFTLTALVMAVMWLVVIRYVVELAGRRVWDTMLVAASPLLIVHAFTNWDIPSILLAVGAMVAYQRGRYGWAGLWIGLGTAVKLWPLFLMGAYLVLAARRRHWMPFVIMVNTAVGSWLAVNLPVLFAHPRAWSEFLRLNSERGSEWTTIYQLFTRITGVELGADFLNTVSFGLFATSCLAIAILGFFAPRTPRSPELIFLILAAFLLFNKVWSPQYSLWLVIPAVLALPHWRLLLTWMTVEMLVWPATMIFMGAESGNGMPPELFNLVIITRDALVITLVVLVVRKVLGRAEKPEAFTAPGSKDRRS